MSLYSISLFLHIVGALALFAALSLEWAGLYGLRRASSAGQAREWLRLLSAPRFAGGPAALTLVITGIYQTAARWGGQGWIVVALGAMVTMAALGPALGARRVGAIARDLLATDGPIATSLGARLRDPVLTLSLYLRTALFLGIVFLMSSKPGLAGSLTAMGAAVALGLAAGLPRRSAGASATQTGRPAPGAVP